MTEQERLRKLKRILRDLRQAKGNQTIDDLDKIVEEFDCEIDTNSANENRLYYAPFRDLPHPRENVAIPHHGKVLTPYVGKVIRMLQEILDRLEQEQRRKDGDLDD